MCGVFSEGRWIYKAFFTLSFERGRFADCWIVLWCWTLDDGTVSFYRLGRPCWYMEELEKLKWTWISTLSHI